MKYIDKFVLIPIERYNQLTKKQNVGEGNDNVLNEIKSGKGGKIGKDNEEKEVKDIVGSEEDKQPSEQGLKNSGLISKVHIEEDPSPTITKRKTLAPVKHLNRDKVTKQKSKKKYKYPPPPPGIPDKSTKKFFRWIRMF